MERKNGAILSYLSIFMSTVIQLLYTPFLIKRLGSSEYGLYSIVASIISYLTVLDFGFGDAIIMYTAKYKAQGKEKEEQQLQGMFLKIFTVIGFITFVLGIVIYFLTPLLFSSSMTIEEISKMKIMILILSFNLAITFPMGVYGSIIKAYEKFTFQKIISIMHTLILPLIMIPMLFIGGKSVTLSLVTTIGNMFVLYSNYIYCEKKLKIKVKFSKIDKPLFKAIFSYSFYIFLNIIVDRINWSVDQTILGIYVGTTAVSCYAVAARINDLFIKLSTAISGILFPKVSKMIAANCSDKEMSDEFIKVGRLQLYIVFLMTTGLIVFGKQFFNLWVGSEYSSAYYVSLFLIIPLSIPLIQNLGISILQAKNIHKFRSILYSFVAIGNILLSIPLAKNYGEIGSAIGTALSLTIGNIIIMNIYYQLKAKINIIEFWKQIFSMIIRLVIPLLLIILIKKLYFFNNWADIILYGGLYIIMYLITAYNFVMNSYEKFIIQKIFKKVMLIKVKE